MSPSRDIDNEREGVKRNRVESVDLKSTMTGMKNPLVIYKDIQIDRKK